jgi:hypothetical protein
MFVVMSGGLPDKLAVKTFWMRLRKKIEDRDQILRLNADVT